jgi:BMFP domain-containing protein YqiC
MNGRINRPVDVALQRVENRFRNRRISILAVLDAVTREIIRLQAAVIVRQGEPVAC